jgi:NADPH:quinone reductase-like Zn-dependent oxidoreductase
MLAAGVNPVDLAIGSGRFYGDMPDPPFIVGAEVVGEVVESDTVPLGTRVWAIITTGGFAEFCSAPDGHLIPVPDEVDNATAAAYGVAGLAGWMSVRTRGEVRQGETVLVLGASGVVGQVAIQTARQSGAGRIIAVSRTQEGIDRALGLGADTFVAIGDRDVATELHDACAPGADLVIDMLWGPPFQMALGAAAPRARFIQVGNAAATTATVPGGSLRGGRFDLRGFSVFTEAHADVERSYHDLLALVHAGAIRLAIEPLPLMEAPVAWMRQAAGTAGRKLVLVNP